LYEETSVKRYFIATRPTPRTSPASSPSSRRRGDDFEIAAMTTGSIPPIPSRDSGGGFTLNNPDDGTPITQMFALDDGLLMITEKCTYRVRLADQIDPDRKNPALPPNFQQKLFDYGTKSELLCRTLLQAKVMFRKELQSIDIDRAMHLSFDAFSDLVSMHEAAQAFKSAEKAAMAKAETLERKDASLAIPAVGNVRGHCKTFAQKADHFAVSLLAIIRLFYPEMKGEGWDAFHELVKSRYGENDTFFKVSELATPFLQLVRNARDCLEHANLKGVKTTDFEPQPDGTIAPPSIEIDFRKSTHDRCPISWFMEETTKALLDSFEMVIVHTCSKNIQPFAGMPLIVALLPENYRSAWHVRFGYGMYYQDGQFAPCG
jgi:hypothetical protein